jgi:hypothetical protein
MHQAMVLAFAAYFQRHRNGIDAPRLAAGWHYRGSARARHRRVRRVCRCI